jgi:glycosyltransferase involved in cell wall biosynthesis
VFLIKVRLSRQVDLFISYMRHSPELEASWKIEASRHEFVPFKANEAARQLSELEFAEQDYVFTGGKSRRDFSTFCKALKLLGYPAVIVTPHGAEAGSHETYIEEVEVPSNVTVVHDDGSSASWIKWISESRLVVYCIAESSISPSGVGAYLESMALGKCVVITECPATRGILTNGEQALLVPQSDVRALANAIRTVWTDDRLRHELGERGRAYAVSLGGEKELVQRIADAVCRRYHAECKSGAEHVG